jgi:ribosome-binding protein aMBF1 (putative translation factor)
VAKKAIDTSFHERMMNARLKDPVFRERYERSRREIDLIDSVIHQLDHLREEAGLSKAELARMIGRNPSSIRRLFTQRSNPELALVASIAAELGAELKVVPPRRTKRREPASA